jgi:hypothetical protein
MKIGFMFLTLSFEEHNRATKCKLCAAFAQLSDRSRTLLARRRTGFGLRSRCTGAAKLLPGKTIRRTGRRRDPGSAMVMAQGDMIMSMAGDVQTPWRQKMSRETSRDPVFAAGVEA